MKTNQIYFLGILFFFLFSFNSCISTSSMQTAKTLPKGKLEFGAGGLVGKETEVRPSGTDFAVVDVLKVQEGYIWSRIGLGANLDLGLKASQAGLLADVKWQFVGDQESLFAMGTGLGVGAGILWDEDWLIDDVYPHYQAHLPLYMSIHPHEKFEVFVNPKYILWRASSELLVEENNFHFVGGSGGFFFGNKFKVGAEVSVFRLLTEIGFGDVKPLVQVGLGFKYQL